MAHLSQTEIEMLPAIKDRAVFKFVALLLVSISVTKFFPPSFATCTPLFPLSGLSGDPSAILPTYHLHF